MAVTEDGVDDGGTGEERSSRLVGVGARMLPRRRQGGGKLVQVTGLIAVQASGGVPDGGVGPTMGLCDPRDGGNVTELGISKREEKIIDSHSE
ncbi:hypothetical protein LXL04_018440 [Taraxacum kok-saghyz]